MTLLILSNVISTFKKNETIIRLINEPLVEGRSVTLVTAYFELTRNKHNGRYFYTKWARNVLMIKSPMVIFTDNKELFKPIRDSFGMENLTVYVETSLKALTTTKTYIKSIQDKLHMDIERYVNNPELYALWYAKPEMVSRAVKLNPFGTQKYMWIDIGCIRDGPLKSNNWPSKARERFLGYKKTILLQGTGGQSDICRNINSRHGMYRTRIPTDDNLPEITDVTQLDEYKARVSIAGSMFGGDSEVLLWFAEIYFKEIGNYLNAKKQTVLMSDQFLSYAVACKYNQSIEVIIPDNSNTWNYLHDYLS